VALSRALLWAHLAQTTGALGRPSAAYRRSTPRLGRRTRVPTLFVFIGVARIELVGLSPIRCRRVDVKI
jgi:hypothetical protein